ncbi:hypothetical protein H5410_002177 [Solanum commersonii]|uniref:Uncharacterized protein n=1 Tax=Solanum commersonii TaxID=4109 RepID=A0A9J6B1B8_SOLCO|nr:hypothetical protein H5410_002177 [Solanum commersonii]
MGRRNEVGDSNTNEIVVNCTNEKNVSYSYEIHESFANYSFIIVQAKYHPTFARICIQYFFDRKSTINSTFGPTICEKCTINSTLVPQYVSSQRIDGIII